MRGSAQPIAISRFAAIALLASLAALGGGWLLAHGAEPRTAQSAPDEGSIEAPQAWPQIAWRSSRAVGKPFAGRLVAGVQLPSEGDQFFTWDPIRKRSPNRDWRRWGSDRLLLAVMRVIADYRSAYPDAPRVGIGDLSRPHGGDFGPRFGGLGHASHQNGLDVDVYYPRLDRLERRPYSPAQVDRRLARALVERFARAEAQYVFVGPRVGLAGPRRVEVLAHHDDHLHFRISRDASRAARSGPAPDARAARR